MKIVIACPGLPFDFDTKNQTSLGGSETACIEFADTLARAGHRVTVFTTHKNPASNDVKYLSCGDITEDKPLGSDFDFYATNTPHDILIVQRHMGAFVKKYAAKQTYWWLHDVPDKSLAAIVNRQLPNVTGIFCVSKWHKNEVEKAWDIDPSRVHAIGNAVEFSELVALPDMPENEIQLLYTSRPERGLIELVRPGGIMDKLVEVDPRYQLYTCAYENAAADGEGSEAHAVMKIAEANPNVTVLPSLAKPQLHSLQAYVDLIVYPSNYVETSCISMIEAMHAGTPAVTTNLGALTETCSKAGIILLDPASSDALVAKFVKVITTVMSDTELMEEHEARQMKAAERYTWNHVGTRAMLAIDGVFEGHKPAAKMREMMRNGDILALTTGVPDDIEGNAVIDATHKELALYTDLLNGNEADYYKRRYEHETHRGEVYNQSDMSGNIRFEAIANRISHLPAGSKVLEYGCAHGHIIINLAKRFPLLDFVGVDITASNLALASEWVADDEVSNVELHLGQVDAGRLLAFELGEFAAVIAAEVLEHVVNVQEHVRVLSKYLDGGGKMVITTPYGPWEYLDIKGPHPFRSHIHHFEHTDIIEMYGDCEGFDIVAAPQGFAPTGEALGCYIYSMHQAGQGEIEIGSVNYQRKWHETLGRETVSACILVGQSASSILRMLNSIEPIVDEVIIRLDAKQDLWKEVEVIESFALENPFISFDIRGGKSPLDVGFDVARNETLEAACGDWILWLDTDEELVGTHNLSAAIKSNAVSAYSIAQHHFSQENPGVEITDYPIRAFRNWINIQFTGVVHEHPENGLNRGIQYANKVDFANVAHYGYTSSNVKAERFARNLPLMRRDRVKNPKRLIGRFLWIRDLSQLAANEYQTSGRTAQAVAYCEEGIALWRGLMYDKGLRFAVDALPFVSALNEIKYGRQHCFNVTYTCAVTTGLVKNNPDTIEVLLGDVVLAEKFFKLLTVTAFKDAGDTVDN